MDADPTPPSPHETPRERIWRAVAIDGLDPETALIFYNRVLAFGPSDTTEEIKLDDEFHFVEAARRIAGGGAPEARVALALMVDAEAIDQAERRFETLIGAAGADRIDRLREKAALFAPIRPRIAIEAYRRLIEVEPVEAVAWVRLAELHRRVGDLPRAAASYREMVVVPGIDPAERAAALTSLGQICETLGDHGEAERHYRGALDGFLGLNFEAGVLDVLLRLGEQARRRGDVDEAREWYLKLLAREEASGDLNEAASTMSILAGLARQNGDLETAATWARDAVERHRAAGSRLDVLRTMGHLGNLEVERGDLRAASRSYERVLDLADELGDRRAAVDALLRLGRIALERGKSRRARHWLERARDLALASDDGEAAGEAYAALAELADQRGRRDDAALLLESAVREFERSGAYAAAGYALASRANLLAEAHEIEPALDAFRRALALLERAGDRSGMAATRYDLGILEKEAGDTASA